MFFSSHACYLITRMGYIPKTARCKRKCYVSLWSQNKVLQFWALYITFGSLVPSPRPAFHRLQYVSFACGESLGSWKEAKPLVLGNVTQYNGVQAGATFDEAVITFSVKLDSHAE